MAGAYSYVAAVTTAMGVTVLAIKLYTIRPCKLIIHFYIYNSGPSLSLPVPESEMFGSCVEL